MKEIDLEDVGGQLDVLNSIANKASVRAGILSRTIEDSSQVDRVSLLVLTTAATLALKEATGYLREVTKAFTESDRKTREKAVESAAEVREKTRQLEKDIKDIRARAQVLEAEIGDLPYSSRRSTAARSVRRMTSDIHDAEVWAATLFVNVSELAGSIES